jgi:hypothetical protein
MAAKRLGLISLIASILSASATIAPAQTLNPSTSLAVTAPREIAVSPSTPGTTPGQLSGETTGTNSLTGLPCSGRNRSGERRRLGA